MPLQIRRGTTAERLSITPLVGEPVFDTTLNQIFVGDGTTAGGLSPDISSETVEQALDTVGAALVNGVHQNISFTYGTEQDADNRIDATVSVATLLEDLDLNEFDIVGTGNINITGQVTADVTGNITGDVIGNITGDVTGNITGDVIGSVFADNSTLLVDSVAGQIVGDINASLGADLNLNNFDIVGTGDIDIAGQIFCELVAIDTSLRSNSDNRLSLITGNLDSTTPTTFTIETDVGSFSTLALMRNGSDLSPAGTSYGRVTFEKTDDAGGGITGAVIGGSDFLLIAQKTDPAGSSFPDEGCIMVKDTGIGIGTKTPSENARIDINGIMKLRPQTTTPVTGEAGMIAIADGNTAGWDPKGTNLGVPYPMFYDGESWRQITLV